MAAPATTPRVEASGIRLDDGFASQLAFAADANVSFWEKTVQPPGFDGGDAIPTTTMFNVTYRTKAARSLIDLTDGAVVAAYDPLVFTEILSLVNVEDSITVHFPDGSTLDFWGFLKSFEPQDLTEGEQPEANVVVVVTNWDPNNNEEAGPVMTEIAGT